MTKYLDKTTFTVGLLMLLLAVPAFGATVNKSIKIGEGAESDGATSVNGSISVGADAIVSGGLRTVNGTIRVDSGARIRNASTVNGSLRLAERVQAHDLSTVNGSVKLGEEARADGDVKAVNGRISLARGSVVAEDVGNVNGQIEISAAEVGGDVETTDGDIELADGAVIKGDLRVEKPSGWSFGKKMRRKPRIVIGPGCRVEGVIDVEREVELFISDSAQVGGVTGAMTLDGAQRFSGKRP